MIDKAVNTIISKLKTKMGLEGSKLSYAQADTNQLGKILCSVSHINLEAALASRTYRPERQSIANIGVLRFRLSFSANFEAAAYVEGLRHLSTILHFLHQHSLLTVENTPDLAEGIDKIAISPFESTEAKESLPRIAFEVRVMPLENGDTQEAISANII
ncbi:MAG: Pvc16 family protein [Bacteroidota bacterium]